MAVTVIERPAAIVSLAEAKGRLRVDHSDDDSLIDALILAAQQHIDAPSGWLWRAIGLQTLELSLDGRYLDPTECVDLPYPPFVHLVSYTYDDLTGSVQTLPADFIEVTVRHGIARIRPADGARWPSAHRSADAVRVRYRAGYANPDFDAMPIKQAILLMVGHWYRNPEATTATKMEVLPMGVDALLSPYRIWRV